MRVSIITPTYNRAELLPETIDSILSQDYPDIEYIVLDDGSKDDTQSVLQRYAGRIRTERHDNMGETATVNKGFALATGDIICVVSSDDPLLPGAVRHAVETFEKHPDALVAYPDWAEIGPQSEFLRAVHLPDYDIHTMLLTQSWGLGPGTFFRQGVLSTVGNRNPKLVYCGDMDFWARVAMRGRLVHVPRVLATHRVHLGSASVSQRGSGFAEEWVGVWRSLLNSSYLPSDIAAQRGNILRLVHGIAARYYCGNDRWHGHLIRVRGILQRKSQQLAHGIAARYYCGNDWWHGHLIRVRGILQRKNQQLAANLKKLASRALPPLFHWAIKEQRWRLRVQPINRAKFVGGTAVFAVCTRFAPPLSSGQAVVLGRLLGGLAPESYCLVSPPLYPGQAEQHFTDALPGKRMLLPAERNLRPFNRLSEFWRRLNLLWQIWQRGQNIATAIKHEGVDTVIGCSGDLLDPPAAYVASRILGCRLVLYFFDDYTEQWWADPALKAFIGKLERLIAPRAAQLLSPNEFMKEEIWRRHGMSSIVVRNPRQPGPLPDPVKEFPAAPPEIRLVFTGAVYHLNYDILQRLLAAIDRLPDMRLKLHVYTAQPREQIEREGIAGPHVEIHGHVTPAEAFEVQRNADILLIPFSFREDAKGIVRTASTAKLADYLAAGRPILALCPEDSFLAWYLTKHECGVVVPTDDPASIAAAIAQIANNAGLRERLSRNALEHARREFDPTVAQDRFVNALGLLTLPTHLRKVPAQPAQHRLNIAHVTGYDILGIQVNGFLLHKYLQEQGYKSDMLVYGKISGDANVHEVGGPSLRRLNALADLLQQRLSLHSLLLPLSLAVVASPLIRDADIVHFHLIHNSPFFSLLDLPRLSRRKRVLLSVHDMFLMSGHCVYSMDCERWKTGCGKCPDLDLPFQFRRDTTALNWKIKRRIFEQSRLEIVVGSRWEEERVRQSPLLGHFPMHHVPYCVDTRAYKTGDKRTARARLGIPEDVHVIAFRSVPFSKNFKGFEYIHAALMAYAPRRRTWLLTFEGRGGLTALRGKYEIMELGWVFDQEKIAQALQAADIFLMPSIAEAFGMMATDSMACGTPVIVFEGTALPETIDAPNSGVAVPYKDADALHRAIEQCLDSPDYLDRLRQNGLRHVAAKHSFQAYAEGYLSIYERLAAKVSA